jgi:hypothetical protein
MKWIVPIFLVLLAFASFWAIGCYNRLQALRAGALLALAQHAAAVAARNEVIRTISEALASNLQHERALFSSVVSEVHRNSAVAEAATLSRGSADAMATFTHCEQCLLEKLQALKDMNAAYPELTVNEQLAGDWQALEGAVARCRFSAEQFNAQAATLNSALAQQPANSLARVFHLTSLASLHVPAMNTMAYEGQQASLLM